MHALSPIFTWVFAMDAKSKTIYVPLLDEGLPVLRPTQGICRNDGYFEVLPTPKYDPEDEHWEYPPHSIVACVIEAHEGEDILVARQLVSDNKK